MAAITICSDFGAQKNKVSHCFQCFPIYLPWSDGTRCHDLSFLSVLRLHQTLLVIYNIYFCLLKKCHWQGWRQRDSKRERSVCERQRKRERTLKWKLRGNTTLVLRSQHLVPNCLGVKYGCVLSVLHMTFWHLGIFVSQFLICYITIITKNIS